MSWVDVKWMVKALVYPPGGPLLLVALGLLWARWRPRGGRSLAWAGLALAWALSLPAIGNMLCLLLESGQRPLDAQAWASASAASRAPGAVVVVGTGARRDGSIEPRFDRPTSRTLERLWATAHVARLTGLPVALVGAPPAPGDPPEVDVMRRVLDENFGLAARWSEGRAPDTDDKAADLAVRLKGEAIDAIVLVAHATHMPRLRRVFERAGFDVLPAPHNFRGSPPFAQAYFWLPSSDGLEASWIALLELSAVAWYRLLGTD